MKYGIIGAGAMGYRFGVILQKMLMLMLTSLILGSAMLKPFVNKVAFLLPVIMRIGI